MNSNTSKFALKIKQISKKIGIPLVGISLYEMYETYGEEFLKMNINRIAAAISWSFFLSLFPFILFLLSILPYLPHYDELQHYIFEVLIPNIFPAHMQIEVTQYLQNFLIPNIENISTLTIILAIVFATNGTSALINGFNHNVNNQRGFIWEYFVAFAITLSFVVFIILSLLGVYYSEIVLKILTPDYNISWLTSNISKIVGFLSFPIFYALLLSLFYWAGCTKIIRWKQSLPGTIFTTLLFMMVTFFFAIYVRNFANYNILYGSIGTIILVMVWINLNIVLILLGNELNIAIQRVKENKLGTNLENK